MYAKYYNYEKYRRIRENRIKAGLCAKCGKNEPREGNLTCDICLNKQKEQVESCKKAGLCRLCKAPTVDGKTLCELCFKHIYAKQKAKRDEVRKNGICTKCLKYPVVIGRKQCKRCLEKQRERRRYK